MGLLGRLPLPDDAHVLPLRLHGHLLPVARGRRALRAQEHALHRRLPVLRIPASHRDLALALYPKLALHRTLSPLVTPTDSAPGWRRPASARSAS
eukprot:scaffold22303_cov67-Phaeocystis_antarctica.AAC.8